MKVNRNNIVPLVRQIKAGMIHRAQFPELWPTTLEPVEVQAADRRRMIREVLRGGIDSEAYPDLWEMLKEPDKVFRRVRDKKTGELKLSRPAQAYNPGRGVYRSSVMNARRLTRTEVNMAYRASDHDRWNRLDFILGIEIKLSKSHSEKMPEGDICDEAAGKYPKEFKFVGFHPLCYCYAVPVLPSKTDFVEHLTEGAPITGHVSEIPEGLKEWVASNRDRVKNYKSQPFWVEDNFKDGRIDKGLDLHNNNRNRAMTASVTP